MTKASVDQLGELHSVLATVIKDKLQGEESSAAWAAAAITFLKNNKIEADPSANEGLLSLEKTLAARRQRKAVGVDAASLSATMDDMARSMGLNLQ